MFPGLSTSALSVAKSSVIAPSAYAHIALAPARTEHANTSSQSPVTATIVASHSLSQTSWAGEKALIAFVLKPARAKVLPKSAACIFARKPLLPVNTAESHSPAKPEQTENTTFAASNAIGQKGEAQSIIAGKAVQIATMVPIGTNSATRRLSVTATPAKNAAARRTG